MTECKNILRFYINAKENERYDEVFPDVWSKITDIDWVKVSMYYKNGVLVFPDGYLFNIIYHHYDQTWKLQLTLLCQRCFNSQKIMIYDHAKFVESIKNFDPDFCSDCKRKLSRRNKSIFTQLKNKIYKLFHSK